MPAVMLKPDWPTTFHRSVRDKEGKKIKLLSFGKSDPQLLSEEEFAAVKDDIGLSLVIAHVDSDGVPTGKVADDQQAKRKRK